MAHKTKPSYSNTCKFHLPILPSKLYSIPQQRWYFGMNLFYLIYFHFEALLIQTFQNKVLQGIVNTYCYAITTFTLICSKPLWIDEMKSITKKYNQILQCSHWKNLKSWWLTRVGKCLLIIHPSTYLLREETQ